MKLKVIDISADVLILGGGLAGCMAAIRAAEEEGLQVTLVDKCNTVASGCAAAGIDHLWGYIPPIHEKMGYTLDDMAEDHRQGIAHGFFRRDLFDLVAGTLYDRVLDLEKFGLKFRYEDSRAPGKFRVVDQFHSVPSAFNFDGVPLKPTLTRQAKKRGVKILNRVQVTDLITTRGQISGAVGVHVRTGDIYFFKAKAVVLSSGRSNRLGRNPVGFDFNTRMPAVLSGDGTSMAMRAGLPIVNCEFLGDIRPAPCANYNPNYGDPRNTVQPAARIIDGHGAVIVPRTQFYNWEELGKQKWSESRRKEWLLEHKASMGKKGDLMGLLSKGGGPYYLDFSEATDFEKQYTEWSIGNEGRGTQFLRYFKGEEKLDLRDYAQEYSGYWTREMSGTAAKGLWVDKDLETGIVNLFGAGDEVAGMPWQAGPGAITEGWHAGEMAARRAKAQKKFLSAGKDSVKAREKMCASILGRKEGFYWREVEIHVQNLMDFYCGSVRSEHMLKRGLERLEYAKAAPLKAENPHELGRALDVKSIMDNAELILRSSLERKESRPTPFGFQRADFPEKDDENWLVFLGITKGEDGKFSFRKFPVDKR
jgi:succinate dehydrogenase/fumarate reductase flavoprotein subunit